MTLLIKGTSVEVIGTFEIIYGVAKVSGLDEDGQIIWTGETSVWWDSQVSFVEDGRPVWVDEAGRFYEHRDVIDVDLETEATPVRELDLTEYSDYTISVVATGRTMYVVEYARSSGVKRLVFLTEAAVERYRQKVAAESWSEVFPDQEIPSDLKIAADKYFATTAQGEDQETFLVHTCFFAT